MFFCYTQGDPPYTWLEINTVWLEINTILSCSGAGRLTCLWCIQSTFAAAAALLRGKEVFPFPQGKAKQPQWVYSSLCHLLAVVQFCRWEQPKASSCFPETEAWICNNLVALELFRMVLVYDYNHAMLVVVALLCRNVGCILECSRPIRLGCSNAIVGDTQIWFVPLLMLVRG